MIRTKKTKSSNSKTKNYPKYNFIVHRFLDQPKSTKTNQATKRCKEKVTHPLADSAPSFFLKTARQKGHRGPYGDKTTDS